MHITAETTLKKTINEMVKALLIRVNLVKTLSTATGTQTCHLARLPLKPPCKPEPQSSVFSHPSCSGSKGLWSMCWMQRPDRAWQTALQGVPIPASWREGLHTNQTTPSLEINHRIRWMLFPSWIQPCNESHQVQRHFDSGFIPQNNSGCDYLVWIDISKLTGIFIRNQ